MQSMRERDIFLQSDILLHHQFMHAMIPTHTLILTDTDTVCPSSGVYQLITILHDMTSVDKRKQRKNITKECK